MNFSWNRSWLVVVLLAMPGAERADAAGRPAEAILADYNAVPLPKSDPTRRDPASIREFREAYGRAEAEHRKLALELFEAHPDRPEVPSLLMASWPGLMMDRAQAAPLVGEIDRALPLFGDPKQARTAQNMRAIAVIYAHLGEPEVALAAVDDFIRADPKDPRNVVLLSGFAGTVTDPALRAKLLRRVVADYPDSPAAKSAEARLALLDRVGRPLDLEFREAITGAPVSIAGLKGKVVVLDFWATWCGPCVAEMPKMKDLYRRFKDQGVEFIGVSLDAPPEEGGLDRLKAFVGKNEIPWPQYYQGNGWDSEFSRQFGIESIPQLFLVDAEGKLASVEARGQLETLLPEYLARAKDKAPASAPAPAR